MIPREKNSRPEVRIWGEWVGCVAMRTRWPDDCSSLPRDMNGWISFEMNGISLV